MNRKTVLILFLFVCSVLESPAQRNPLRDSLAVASEKLAMYPDSVDLRLKKAGWNILLEQWQYAKDEYDKILRRNPSNVSALFFRAYANERLGRYNYSRLDYQNLLQIVPGYYEAQLGLVLLNQKDKHLTEAYDGINRMIEAFPDSAALFMVRGELEKEQGMIEMAEYDYRKAVEMNPQNEDYLLNYADLLILLKKKKEAKEILRRLEKGGIPRLSLKQFYERLK